jgi:hypothetical protein
LQGRKGCELNTKLKVSIDYTERDSHLPSEAARSVAAEPPVATVAAQTSAGQATTSSTTTTPAEEEIGAAARLKRREITRNAGVLELAWTGCGAVGSRRTSLSSMSGLQKGHKPSSPARWHRGWVGGGEGKESRL